VSWITGDWRLKLLALGLAVLMLGAVAFSQNPPTSKTLTRNIDYVVPPGLMVINPPTRATVTVTGLGDVIATVTSNSVVVTIDLTKVSPGPNVNVTPVARSLVSGVFIANQPNPVALNIDQRGVMKLAVTVRTPRITSGWEITKAEARCPTAPCSVTFDGPLSLESNLKAYADFTGPVENSSYDVPTQSVVLEQNGTPLDLGKLNTSIVPPPTLDVYTVSIHIEAKSGTTSRQVVLIDSPPSNPPPNCYRVTNVAIDPITVILSGAPGDLSPITTLTLPAVDLSKATSSTTFKVTIPYPDNVTGSAATAKVTYSIAQNPNCTSPTPT
jgi:YbbR domain-containing protein